MTLLQIHHLCWNLMLLYAMNELSCNGIPCISLKYCNSNLWGGSVVIMKLEKCWKLIKFEDLKDPRKILVQCFKKEYKTYILKEKDIDVEKVILGNPLLPTFVPQLFQYMKMYTDDDITRIHKEFMNDMVRNFLNKASHPCITFENLTEATATTEMTHTCTTMDNDNMTEAHES